MKTRCLFLVFLGWLLAGCVHEPPGERPAALDQGAARFKSKAGLDRVAEGNKIAALLPVCPVSRQRWWHLGFDDEGMVDWQHPSYRLPKEDLLQAFGTPDRLITLEELAAQCGRARFSGRMPTKALLRLRNHPAHKTQIAYASYDLGPDRRNDEWELLVTFYQDYVAGGRVIKRGTVQSISTHTNPDGSTTVVTNYLP